VRWLWLDGSGGPGAVSKAGSIMGKSGPLVFTGREVTRRRKRRCFLFVLAVWLASGCRVLTGRQNGIRLYSMASSGGAIKYLKLRR